MESSRRVEKRMVILNKFAEQFQNLGVPTPDLPDPEWPKRRFEKDARKIRLLLREMELADLVGSVRSQLEGMTLTFEGDSSEPS